MRRITWLTFMATQVIDSPAVNASRPPLVRRGPRGRSLKKTAYSAMRRLVGSGRLAPWLDCVLLELFQAEAGDLRQIARMPKAFSSRLATRDDAAELGAFFGSPDRVQQRLDRGDVCAVVVAGGQICAGAWLIPGPATIEDDWNDVRCCYQIPAGTVWGYDGRGTKPGAWGCLIACLPGYMAELGAERIAVSIHYNNHRSIDSHLSAGFHSAGWIGCLRILGLTARTFRTADRRWRRLPGRIGLVEVLK